MNTITCASHTIRLWAPTSRDMIRRLNRQLLQVGSNQSWPTAVGCDMMKSGFLSAEMLGNTRGIYGNTAYSMPANLHEIYTGISWP
jgi:hypothetical protein